MPKLVDVMPHGDLSEVFPNVFMVTGTSRPTYMGVNWQFSRNMTVVREGDALTLVNTVRLDEAGLARLDELGKVANVVKIGAFHGYDDPFYLDRYDAKQWALPGHEHDGGQTTDQELTVGGPMPFSDAGFFTFETSNHPEGLLLIEREGGIVVSCDSIQNWAEVDDFFSEESGRLMTEYGFIKPANIGPGWRRSCEPEKSDFDRLLALTFRHLLPAHGRPIVDDAHEQLSATFAAAFA